MWRGERCRVDGARGGNRDGAVPAGPSIGITERDDGRSVIALPSNRSTGCHWSTALPTNVTVLGDIVEQRPRGATIGGGGTSLVGFRVTRPGRADIAVMYLPPGGGSARKMLVYRFRGIRRHPNQRRFP